MLDRSHTYRDLIQQSLSLYQNKAIAAVLLGENSFQLLKKNVKIKIEH